MTPERYKQIEDLYHAAAELASDRRSEFLRQTCGDDKSLFEEVQALLAVGVGIEEHSFLTTPAINVVAAGVAASRTADESAPLIGQVLGCYEVKSVLGRGGMGAVYRARDSRLKRDVAIKVLPPEFSRDANRVARFHREAEILASLNHPHVAAIYDFAQSGESQFLVLELVGGETVADRISRGPLDIQEALRIALQVAEALEAAHEKGIIHRDLKPENIKITPDAEVKVLDFGLAKVFICESDSVAPSQSPALTSAASAPGMILGTPAYMSPEQARGKPVDQRTDIWAIGAVLYEMLSGVSAFGGSTTAEALVRVMGERTDYSAIPADAPANVQRLIRRCLEKDPRRRVQHMGDVRLELDEALSAIEAGAPSGNDVRVGGSAALNSVRRPKLLATAGALAIGLAASVVVWALTQQPASRPPSIPLRLSVPFLQAPLVEPFSIKHVAISDDGSRVAYASTNGLWVRRLDQKEPTLLVRSAAAGTPFFSPDGTWIAFYQDGLRKIAVDGGTPVQLAASTARYLGGTWHAKGGIVFATTEGLYHVAPEGGAARLLVTPNYERKERVYAWPQFLPDGEAVIFTIVPEGDIGSSQIAVLGLRTLQSRVVLTGGTSAQHSMTGHLVYASGRTLKAIAFDADRRETKGDAVSFLDTDVFVGQDNGAADFALSGNGTLVFLSNFVRNAVTLRWMDRNGKEEILPLQPGSYQYPRVSPDGKRVAVNRVGETGRDIWILNLERMSVTQLPDNPTEDLLPMWNRDGSRIFFSSDRTGNFDIYSQAWDGATGPRLEFAGPETQFPNAFTPDGGRLIVYHFFKDLTIVDLAKPDRMMPLLNSEFDERLAEISPDGNWMAYESDESGRRVEVMMRPFPNVGERREQISIDGGRYPLWSPKGDELFYVTPNGEMMSVAVRLSPALQLGRPSKLFDMQKPPTGRSGRIYDISPIDGRFMLSKPLVESPETPTNVSVVLNWSEELRKQFASR